MKVKHKLLVIALLLSIVFTMSAVAAAENATFEQSNIDEVSTETLEISPEKNEEIKIVKQSFENENDNKLKTEKSELLTLTEDQTLSANNNTFSHLQELIDNSNGTLVLNQDYELTDNLHTNGLIINKSITIDGNNHVLNANKLGRIFNITASNVVLKNIKFVNGLHSSNGGAIYWNAANGFLLNCSFYNNSGSNGGALFSELNSLSLDNCNFENNSAIYGGAIYLYSNGLISNSTFINNSASYGGAIFINGDNSLIMDSYFIDNFAKYHGGAVKWQGNNGNLTNCNFTNNLQNRDVNNIKSCGGAVYWGGSNGYLNKCNFTNNTANADGGAVYWVGSDGILLNSNFNNNSALTSAGGAVTWDSYQGKNGFLSNCYFINNYAGIGGGAVNWAMLGGVGGTLTNSIFINNTAKSSASAIDWNSNNGNISNCTFLNNAAYYFHGGAILISGHQCTISDCDFIDNYGYSGGAIYIGYIYGANCNIINCLFVNNTANNGGAIYLYEKYGTVINCTFENNSADYGGAIYWRGQGGSVSDCSFDNNEANSGGAIYANGGSGGSLVNCNFTNNRALTTYISNLGYGGAVQWVSASNSLINNCIFENNSAKMGGAVYSAMENGRISNCYFINNSANGPIFSSGNDYYGGAISFGLSNMGWSSTNTGIINSVFIDNFAKFGGGAIHSNRGYRYVDGCEFINNLANQGGAIYIQSNLNVSNSYFDGNNATVGSAIYKMPSPYLYLNNFTFGSNQAESSSLTIVKVGDKYVVTFKGRNNILNAIWNNGNVGTVFLDGVSPVLGADNSNNGELYYQDDRELNQTINIQIYDRDDNLLYNGSLLTGIYGEVNISAFNVKKIIATHFNDKFYTGISSSIEINVSVIAQDCESIVNQYVDIPVSVFDQFGPITKGNITLLLNNETYYILANESFVTVKAPSISGIYNVNVTYTDPYGNKLSNSSKLKVYKPDISLSKIALNHIVACGNQVEFEIFVKNIGDMNLSDVVIVEDSFDGLVYDSYLASSLWIYSFVNGKHAWKLNGTFSPGNNASLFVKFNTTKVGIFTNNVAVSAKDLENKNASAEVDVLDPRLYVEKIALTPFVMVGQQAIFEIIIKNTGKVNLNGITLTEDSFDGLIFDSYHESPLWNYKIINGKNVWTLIPSLLPDEVVSLFVTFNTTAAGTFTNTIIVNASNIQNESVTASIQAFYPSFQVEKVALMPVTVVNDQTVFEIVVHNDGLFDIKNVFIIEDEYDGLIYDHFLNDQLWIHSIVNGKHKWTLKNDLVVNETVGLFVVFNTTSVGNFTNYIIAGSDYTLNKLLMRLFLLIKLRRSQLEIILN